MATDSDTDAMDSSALALRNKGIGFRTIADQLGLERAADANSYADFTSSGTLQMRYLNALAVDQVLARTDSSGNTSWYLRNQVGSVIAIASKSKGNRARKLKYVIAAANWLPLLRWNRCQAITRWSSQ